MYLGTYYWIQYYVSTEEAGPCTGCEPNAVADPINPGTGSVYKVETDLPANGTFAGMRRYYNSANNSNGPLGVGWRHSFSRRITPRYREADFKPYILGDLRQSPSYATVSDACTSGFAAIKSKVSNWQTATATFESGECKLTKNGESLGTLRIRSYLWSPYSSPPSDDVVAILTALIPLDGSTLIGYDAMRDDGSVIRFSVGNSSIAPPPGVFAKLEQTTTGFSLTDESDNNEIYDSTGKLLTVRTRGGVETSLGYDGSNRLASKTDKFGHSATLSYDAQGRLLSVTESGASAVQFTFDGQGRLSKATHSDSTERTYLYENGSYPNALTGLKDENNSHLSTWGYDSYGRGISTSEAGGAGAVSLSYNSSNGNVIVTDALGAVRTFTFERHGDKNPVTGISGSQCPSCREGKVTTYTAAGLVTSRTTYRDYVTTYVNDDARGLETSRTEASSTPRARTITTQWHATYRLPTQSEEPGRRSSHTHDSHGNILTKTITDLTVTPNTSRTWTYTYNTFGQVLTADGPRTDVPDITTYTYNICTTGYGCGQVNTITNALGQVTTYNSYNAHGQPLTITDPNGTVTTLTYDLRQRLTSRTVGSDLTTFEYWPTGLLKKATLPDGSYLEYTYDAAHRLTGINDAPGNRIAYTLDAMGNRTKEESFDSSLALSRTRSQVFNTLNQLSQQIGASASPSVTTSYGYDNNGNQTSINAPLGRNTTQTYDELNRLTSVTDPDSGLTQYGYNALDQLISVTDPRGLTTSYTYNGLGDLKQQVSPDTGTTVNTYDSGGNLKTSTDARNAITTYTYDALNRVKTAAFKLGSTTDQTITYNYDAGTNGKGHVTSASDASHSMSWVYDAQGRVTNKTQVQGSVTQSVAYGYTNGLLTAMTTPSGQAVSYAYINGQVVGITINGAQLLNNVLYDPFGPARQWSWGNGTLSVRTFDEDGKITQLDSAGLNTYAYDDAFRITGITDSSNSNLIWTYGYDDLDRLTSASTPTQILGWSYDATGNRLTQTGNSASAFAISPTSNRLTSTTGALARTYTYDAAGNITGNGSKTFAYNNRGRMKSTTTGSTTVSYTYNALGQRIKKTGTVRLFMYDEAGHLLGEYSSTGALVQETIWLGDAPVAILRPKTGGVDIFYIHADHLNTPRKITRPSDNKLRWRWDPTPFGTGTPNENPQSLGTFNYNWRFPGQYYDAESGLNYNYFRNYDSATGRYVESDPMGIEGGLNTYNYAEINPLSYVDPDGRLAWWVIPAGILVYKVGKLAWKYYEFTECVKQCPTGCDEGDTSGNLSCKAKCTLTIWGGPGGSRGPTWPIGGR
jgi:RHS repeat-associated protein